MKVQIEQQNQISASFEDIKQKIVNTKALDPEIECHDMRFRYPLFQGLPPLLSYFYKILDLKDQEI